MIAKIRQPLSCQLLSRKPTCAYAVAAACSHTHSANALLTACCYTTIHLSQQIQGGDFTAGNGTGGKSIYGERLRLRCHGHDLVIFAGSRRPLAPLTPVPHLRMSIPTSPTAQAAPSPTRTSSTSTPCPA